MIKLIRKTKWTEYKASKIHTLICSADLKFLTTL